MHHRDERGVVGTYGDRNGRSATRLKNAVEGAKKVNSAKS